MIKGIVFDCFGVLFGATFSMLLERAGPDKHDELTDLNKQVDYGYISNESYVRQVSKLLGMSYDELVDILAKKHAKNERLLDYLTSLRQRGYKTALLSNVGSGGLEKLFPGGRLDSYFDAVVLSYEEHMTKPHPEMFRLAALRLGLSPGECIMIDDRPDNCEGAEIAGMYAVEHASNDLTIERVEELLAKS